MMNLLDGIERAAFAAGEAILEVYATDFSVAEKSDASPVTVADGKAEAVIVAHLARLAPDIPVIAEEQVEAHGVPSQVPPRFWLVDPLDGTKEFIKRNGEFTVNIALIEHGRPVMGVVGIPAKGIVYGAAGPGTARITDQGGRVRAISARVCPEAGATVAYSRSHSDSDQLEAFLAARKIAARISAGSALKFCLIAEGAADLYPRFGPTMEWDTGAGQAVLEAAGGRVTMLDGTPFGYGKPGFRNPGFIALGRD
jgi:3'(2'), 5'-bisphosphate nucleotidase